jgi:hypothetical protein
MLSTPEARVGVDAGWMILVSFSFLVAGAKDDSLIAPDPRCIQRRAKLRILVRR